MMTSTAPGACGSASALRRVELTKVTAVPRPPSVSVAPDTKPEPLISTVVLAAEPPVFGVIELTLIVGDGAGAAMGGRSSPHPEAAPAVAAISITNARLFIRTTYCFLK